jgi:hypothetical protein
MDQQPLLLGEDKMEVPRSVVTLCDRAKYLDQSHHYAENKQNGSSTLRLTLRVIGRNTYGSIL